MHVMSHLEQSWQRWKPPRTIYEQDAYAHLGGRFPTLMKVQLQESQPAYPAGNYTVHSSSFIVNKFGSIELKRFGMMIQPLEPAL
ncbi:single-stranded DNA-binding protein [Photobacterium sp. DNB23_23_1]